MHRTMVCVALVMGLAPAASAQWPAHPTSGIPRTADGRPDLAAPAPRTSRGTPDLSGLWAAEPDPAAQPEGVENAVFPRYLMNVMKDVPHASHMLTPQAEQVYRQRLANDSVDDPIARCQPPGAARIFSFTRPTKIVETPGLTLLLHEYDTSYRQIFTDGRSLPDDPFPSWMGYSVGAWEGDTFVVTTIGLTDRSWLDVTGHPHSESLRMVERFRRVDAGHLEIAITYTDPGTFTRPLTVTQKLRLLPDAEIIEFFCTDNEKDRAHYGAGQ